MVMEVQAGFGGDDTILSYIRFLKTEEVAGKLSRQAHTSSVQPHCINICRQLH